MLKFQSLKNEMQKAVPDLRVGDDAVKLMQELIGNVIRAVTVEADKFTRHRDRKTVKKHDIVLAIDTTGVRNAYLEGGISKTLDGTTKKSSREDFSRTP